MENMTEMLRTFVPVEPEVEKPQNIVGEKTEYANSRGNFKIKVTRPEDFDYWKYIGNAIEDTEYVKNATIMFDTNNYAISVRSGDFGFTVESIVKEEAILPHLLRKAMEQMAILKVLEDEYRETMVS